MINKLNLTINIHDINKKFSEYTLTNNNSSCLVKIAYIDYVYEKKWYAIYPTLYKTLEIPS